MKRKLRIILSSVVSLVLLILLTSGLHNIQFRSGRPLPNFLAPAVQALAALVQQAGQGDAIPLWKLVLLWSALLLNIGLILFLISPEYRKRILRQIFRFAVTVVALYLVLKNYLLDLTSLNQSAAAGASAGSPLFPGTVQGFQPPPMTPWLSIIASLGMLLVLIFLTWMTLRWWRRRQGRRTAGTLDDIAAIMRTSLDEIVAGQDWSDVVVQAYVRMVQVVGHQRGLHRAGAMTPREFAERLQMAGLPSEAVQQLTRLFESVRYGAHPSDSEQSRIAVTCLNSILSACGVAA